MPGGSYDGRVQWLEYYLCEQWFHEDCFEKKKSCKFAGCSKQIDLFQRFYSTKFILYHLIDLRFSKCCMDTLAKKTKKQTSKQTNSFCYFRFVYFCYKA